MSTRLVIYGPNGNRVAIRDRIAGMDLTDIPNADAQAPLMVVVERECDLGHWHNIGHTPLPLYDVDRDGQPLP